MAETPAPLLFDETKLKEVFGVFDIDGSGFIDSTELRSALKDALTSFGHPVDDNKLDELVKYVMSTVDTSGDGKISFEEFKKAFSSSGDGCCETPAPPETPEPWDQERPDTAVTPEPWTDRPDTACSDAGN